MSASPPSRAIRSRFCDRAGACGARRSTAGRSADAKIVARTERFYELFGWWSVVIGRYIPWGRVFVPVIAGVRQMSYLRFVTANLVGALSWAVAITVIGYFAASNPQLGSASYVIAGVAITASVIAGIRAWRMDTAERLEHAAQT